MQSWIYAGNHLGCIARSKRGGTRAETRFGLSAKQTSPFKSAGVSVQSTAGSRGVRISGQQLYRQCSDVQCKTTGYPIHSHLSPSLPLPCVTVCHQVLNVLHHWTTSTAITMVNIENSFPWSQPGHCSETLILCFCGHHLKWCKIWGTWSFWVFSHDCTKKE